MELPICSGFGEQHLQRVLQALGVQELKPLIWSVKYVSEEIRLEVCWNKALITDITSPNEPEQAPGPKEDGDPFSRQMKRRKKSPSTLKRDQERFRRWLAGRNAASTKAPTMVLNLETVDDADTAKQDSITPRKPQTKLPPEKAQQPKKSGSDESKSEVEDDEKETSRAIGTRSKVQKAVGLSSTGTSQWISWNTSLGLLSPHSSQFVPLRREPSLGWRMIDPIQDTKQASQSQMNPAAQISVNATNPSPVYFKESNAKSRDVPQEKQKRSDDELENVEGDTANACRLFCIICKIPGHDVDDCLTSIPGKICWFCRRQKQHAKRCRVSIRMARERPVSNKMD